MGKLHQTVEEVSERVTLTNGERVRILEKVAELQALLDWTPGMHGMLVAFESEAAAREVNDEQHIRECLDTIVKAGKHGLAYFSVDQGFDSSDVSLTREGFTDAMGQLWRNRWKT